MTRCTSIWDGVDRLLDRAVGVDELRAHRIEVLAASRWRARGRAVPAELEREERSAAISGMVAPAVLERVRAAVDGPLLLLKGPEIASLYPNPAFRPFADLDILSPDPANAHRALLAEGFVPVGDPDLYVGIHHLRPLAFPTLPLPVEIHAEPKWLAHSSPPSMSELLSLSVPSCVGVEGIATVEPAHHTLLVAAHAWAHEPLRRLRDLIDVAAMAQSVDREQLRSVARAWRIARLWETTIEVADALFLGGPTPWEVRLWARNLVVVRDRTVLENHLQRWLSSFSVLPPGQASTAFASALARDLRPRTGESWVTKLSRTMLAIRRPFTPRSVHNRDLDRRDTPPDRP